MFSLLCVLVALVNLNPILGVGEKQVVDFDELNKNENMQSLFREAVNKYNGMINSRFSYAPYHIHVIHKQIVAGLLLEFEVTLIGTNCINQPNNKNNQLLVECGINESLTPVRAHLQIVHQPWLNPQHSFTLLSVVPDYDLKLHDQLFVIGISGSGSVSGLNFDKFKLKYNKVYANEKEELKRYKLFHSNFKRAHLMKLLDKGSVTYGVTQFSDLTQEEFTKQYLSPRWDLTKKPTRMGQIPQDIRTASAIDWRKLGAVTNVKNQGSCGSCWAFSTTGNIEGQWFIKNKQLISLSEQQLVDCDTIDQGCNGGLPSQAYTAIQQMGGLESEDDYPYTGSKGTCQLSKPKIKVYINGSESISTSEVTMAGWCSISGPISIGINAFAMQFYTGGISHPYSIFCNPNNLDHGVLIVGFNATTAGEPFWIIKNSWGSSWGEDGYYRVYRGTGVCGLNKMPTSAVISSK